MPSTKQSIGDVRSTFSSSFHPPSPRHFRSAGVVSFAGTLQSHASRLLGAALGREDIQQRRKAMKRAQSFKKAQSLTANPATRNISDSPYFQQLFKVIHPSSLSVLDWMESIPRLALIYCRFRHLLLPGPLVTGSAPCTALMPSPRAHSRMLREFPAQSLHPLCSPSLSVPGQREGVGSLVDQRRT